MSDKDALSDSVRLAALHASGLMDSEREPIFDRATRLASSLLQTDVNLFSLVDNRRQFFKAELGLPDDVSDARETPLSHSFCQHVVTSGQELVIADARQDARVRDNPSIQDLGVIAYLGMPIGDADGNILGSFCAIETKPRQWTETEIATLRDIAAGVQSEIRLRIEMDRSRQAEDQARSSRDLLSMILESTSDGVMMLDGDWTVLYTNENARKLLMLEVPMEGRVLWDVFDDAEGDPFRISYLDAIGSGQPQLVEAHYPRLNRWFEARSYPREGMLTVFFRDVTAERRITDARQVLVRELDHRIKNIFSVFGAMTSMTARNSQTPREMAIAMQGRLRSLAAAHNLIRHAIRLETDTAQIGEISFRDLLATLLGPHIAEGSSDQLVLSGAYVPLGPNAATQFSLVLHELATNASKYGCFSTANGRLAIGWRIKGDRLLLTWRESGGPAIEAAPVGKGFGSQLVRMTLNAQMRGKVTFDWNPGGVHIDFEIPIESLSH
ncbi:HWE histidine kinase domain-containing protein [Fulvimarina sp. 2208YS6-2-32]|uniref:Blue-light-activated histidine kinase n=1 Tax=Fulvimarina uroteuthidis TaxID=3098149 RepID=A0ABU5I372_9HYPH|nr:GAF domain-containing protein [Fulvimarina sp. 2208YS6-2-32]MDY8109413.1 HWE histidine kinase domain-containing protein [Fulvimarina sp. 2208YS6-2-32]